MLQQVRVGGHLRRRQTVTGAPVTLAGAGATERSQGRQGQGTGMEGNGGRAGGRGRKGGTGHRDTCLPETGIWGGRPRGWPQQPARARG